MIREDLQVIPPKRGAAPRCAHGRINYIQLRSIVGSRWSGHLGFNQLGDRMLATIGRPRMYYSWWNMTQYTLTVGKLTITVTCLCCIEIESQKMKNLLTVQQNLLRPKHSTFLHSEPNFLKLIGSDNRFLPRFHSETHCFRETGSDGNMWRHTASRKNELFTFFSHLSSPSQAVAVNRIHSL